MKDATYYTNDGRYISEKYNPNKTILEFKKRIKNKLEQLFIRCCESK